jgi:alkaline phosphatase D
MGRFSWEDPALGGGAYWTDGWDGYAPARKRLLGVVAERRLPGVVVLGGDVHSNYVSALRADYDDPAAPVVASEFCGTSISSLGLAQTRIDAAMGFNPHVLFGRSTQRGYASIEVTPRQVSVRLQTVDRPLDPDSGITTAARFVVESGHPGPVAA